MKHIMSMAVHHSLTLAYNPIANGMNDKFNRTLIELIKCTLDGQPQHLWLQLIDMCTFAYNTTPHDEISETPFFVLHGFDACTLLSCITPDILGSNIYTTKDYRSIVLTQHEILRKLVMERTGAVQDHSADHVNKHRAKNTFAQGDLVALKIPASSVTGKLSHSYDMVGSSDEDRKCQSSFHVLKAENVTLEYVGKLYLRLTLMHMHTIHNLRQDKLRSIFTTTFESKADAEAACARVHTNPDNKDMTLELMSIDPK